MQVRREIVVAAAVADVWEAVTDSGRLGEWFANEVELDLREGGAGSFRWADGEEREAAVLTVEPPRRFGFSWHEPGEQATQVELTLEETEDGTRVTVVETAPDGAPDASSGWGTALELRAAACALV